MSDSVTLILHMSSGSTIAVSVAREGVDDLLTDAAEVMRSRGQLLLPGAKMLVNGAHLVAVVPKDVIR